MKFRNFGKKSLTELDELVEGKGLTFGMDLSRYKLDKRLICYNAFNLRENETRK